MRSTAAAIREAREHVAFYPIHCYDGAAWMVVERCEDRTIPSAHPYTEAQQVRANVTAKRALRLLLIPSEELERVDWWALSGTVRDRVRAVLAAREEA